MPRARCCVQGDGCQILGAKMWVLLQGTKCLVLNAARGALNGVCFVLGVGCTVQEIEECLVGGMCSRGAGYYMLDAGCLMLGWCWLLDTEC